MSQDKNKIIHDLATEDLLKIINGSKEEVIMDKLSEAAKFIYDLGIKNGLEKISAQLVYHTYKEWKGWDNKRQAKPLFFRDFKKYFNSHRSSDEVYYLLDPKPFDRSKETYWIIRNEIRNEKARKNKKNKKS